MIARVLYNQYKGGDNLYDAGTYIRTFTQGSKLGSRGIFRSQSHTDGHILIMLPYQADDLDAYDSDCDELNSAKVALMVTPPSEQSNVVNHSETEITSDSILFLNLIM
ncbi:hypothetical protein Tco_0232109 [Tanacetum coccineum]